jgi:hypothetical protein
MGRVEKLSLAVVRDGLSAVSLTMSRTDIAAARFHP